MTLIPPDVDILPPSNDYIFSIIRTKKGVGMASEVLMEISQDEVERARFMSRKKFEMETGRRIL